MRHEMCLSPHQVSEAVQKAARAAVPLEHLPAVFMRKLLKGESLLSFVKCWREPICMEHRHVFDG